MIIILFAWPYLILAIFAVTKMRRGMTEHDRSGLIGAATALILMTAALLAFPVVYSIVTGDHTANIGWGLLVMGSTVYCLAFIWAGNLIGVFLSKRKK